MFGDLKLLGLLLDVQFFTVLRNKLPELSEVKVKERIFIGPRIGEFMQDPHLHSTSSDSEKAAWNAFKALYTDFFGEHKAEHCSEIVSEMLKCFQVMKCIMSLKLPLLGFHQDLFLKTLENLSMGTWNCSMITEYCWSTVRETPKC
ncbi:hypothetical protein Cfor_01852, partial [Coptotermes formosanus]